MGFGRRDEETEVDTNTLHDGEEKSGGFRLLPTLIVLAAFSGFGVLAWHAYHYGAQSVQDGELMVVEAEPSPIKEKPLDPGGMKFPNQDKTVFETFSATGSTPPKVERIMPPPEEPMPKNIDASETQTWINDKIKKEEAASVEDVVKKPDAQAVDAQAPAPRIIEVPPATIKATKPDDIVTHVKKPVAEAASPAVKSEPEPAIVAAKEPAKEPALQEKAKPVATSDAKPAAKPSPAATSPGASKPVASGNQRIQLGAYGSEAEAKAAWSKMQAKFPELKGKTVYVVKADLGAKGIFYRLRAGGFGDAKAFCAGLSAKGQACMMVP